MIDDVFVAGMLHDLGKLALITNLPEQYNNKLMLMQEKTLSVLDAEIGAYLIGLWGITDTIVEAPAFHHNPVKCPSKGFGIITAIHVADALGNETCPGEMRAGAPVDYAYIAELGLSERLPVWSESCLKMGE